MVECPAISSVLVYCSSTHFAYFTRACEFGRKVKTGVTAYVSALEKRHPYYATFRRPFVDAFCRLDIRKKKEKHLKIRIIRLAAILFIYFSRLKDECPVNALRAQNLADGHFLGHEIRLVLYPSVSEQSLV